MADDGSVAVPLGTRLPDFALPDQDGRVRSPSDFTDAPALLVAFTSNTCPFATLVRPAFAKMATEYQARGLAVLAVNPNDAATNPEESATRSKEVAAENGFTFAYLKDTEQKFTRMLDVVCTPDFYLFDRERKLVYHGQFDDSRPANGRMSTGTDLRAALNAALAGGPLPVKQAPAVGCGIKWVGAA